MTQTILLVEDEVETAEIVRDYLEKAHYSVEVFNTGEGVVERVRKETPALILLDIMLPEKDGSTICREIRAFSSVPVIMITARVDEVDRLIGYELGADDYICKPVNPREILARVKTVLRRSSSSNNSTNADALTINESKHSAIYKNHPLDLTQTEFRLLKFFASMKGEVFSRKQIIDKVYIDNRDVSERSVDTCIKKLRKKIATATDGDNPIRSIYGIGYKYEDV